MKTVYKSGSQIDIDFVNEYLKNNGLNTLVKHTGAGSYMNITTGYSVSEIQLLVNDDEVEKAIELIKDIEPEKSSSDEPIPKRNTSVRVAAWIIIIVAVLFVLLSLYLT